MRERSIVVVGAVTRDVTVLVPELPPAGGSSLASELTIAAGGKGANPAVAAARLGAGVRLLGAVGDDDAGAAVVAELDGLGVEVSGVARCDGVPTGHILHLVEPGGQRRYVEVVGANGGLRLDAGSVSAACGRGTTLLVSTAMPRAAVETAVAAGRSRGARVVLDVAGEPAVARELLPAAQVVRGDADEIGALLDCRVGDFDSAATAARRIVAQGAQLAVVQAGADGEVFVTGEHELRVPHLDVPVVDPTGGGDALIATLVVLLQRGRPLEDAARLAAAAAAHTVARLGGQPGFRSEAELARLAKT